jgi:exportin-2 (importin alpha re-exporter)
MKFRDVDEELFEDNPQEYIRRDAEGADADTRRRGATDLVRGLSRSFEPQVIQIFTAHIEELLAAATADPAGAWKQKDAAIFLVTSLAVKASVSGKVIMASTHTHTHTQRTPCFYSPAHFDSHRVQRKRAT